MIGRMPLFGKESLCAAPHPPLQQRMPRRLHLRAFFAGGQGEGIFQQAGGTQSDAQGNRPGPRLVQLTMAEAPNDWNQQVIQTFRANDGKVPMGPFANATMVLLHTKGAKSGQERVSPLMSQPQGDGTYAIFASKGGAPENPAWYHNLVKNPRVSFEVGTETVHAVARVATGEERERIWSAQKQQFPQFAEYEEKTPRAIPVIILEPDS